jgi:Cdc6-like AAA superfamily ATPase
MTNPFIPSFGEIPSVFLGRDEYLSRVRKALEKRTSDPYKSVLITGARGSGKTVSIGETHANRWCQRRSVTQELFRSVIERAKTNR